MHTMAVGREILPGGKIKLSSGDCTFIYDRPRPGVLHITISGHDRGQFGTGTIDEILLAIQREGPLELFVDASAASGASVDVSEAWTRFFTLNRDRLERVHVLTRSQFMQLTVAISQHLSRTGDLIRIHSSAASFEGALAGKGK